jgi:hypothetical protein
VLQLRTAQTQKEMNTMKVKITRTTRPAPGETLGYEPEELFAEIVLDAENALKLLSLTPAQLMPTHSHESDDRRWIVKDPLLFHTMVTSIACRGRGSRTIEQLVTLVDLMGPHLTDNWELSWDTMTDLELEIHTDHQEIRFGNA